MFVANRRKDIIPIYFAVRHVVIADLIFTTPSVIVQFITGLLMMHIAGFDFSEIWIKWSVILYFSVGLCWLPVLWLQIKMRDMAKLAFNQGTKLPEVYWKMEKIWIALGSIAFPMVLVIFYFMVMKIS